MSFTLFKAPQSAPPAKAPSTPEGVLKSKARTSAVYTQAKQSVFSQYYGRLLNLDPVLAKHGGGQGFETYYQVRRQITEIGGIIGQLVDGAFKRKPMIVPGDSSNVESVQLCEDARQMWEDIPNKGVVLRKALDTLITCGFSPIEGVWGRHDLGYVAMLKLIDRPAQNFIFDGDENPRFLSYYSVDPFFGEPVDPMKFIFLQDGSMNTPYGESRFIELYSAAWFYQKVREMMLDAIEKYGRPVPHVLYPTAMDPTEVAKLDFWYSQQYGTYTRGQTDGPEIKVEYPAMPMAANGQAGRAEMEALRFLQGTFYVDLIRTQQTQDKTGGSRALETSRDARVDLTVLHYSGLLCEGLQEGWMRPMLEINRPSMDRRLWCKFVPDLTAHQDPELATKWIMEGTDRGFEYSSEEYFRTLSSIPRAKNANDILGHPKAQIRDTTTPAPAPIDPNPQEDANP